MAKIIYACSRGTRYGESERRKLEAICSRLTPDNLTQPPRHTIVVQGRLAYGILNDTDSVIRRHSVLLGCLYAEAAHWDEPGTDYPDGSFALFRNSADLLEVVSDAAASRTIWYYFDAERFVASTSQRAIVMFLGSFEFDDAVIPWMLSSGSLGPDGSWDRRIRRLPCDSSVVLDKQGWSLAVNARPMLFSPQDRSHAEHKALLTREIREVMRSLTRSSHTLQRYLLPLSGGYDSRGILCFLSEGGVPQNLRTVTWGLEQNLTRQDNDAAVAKELASALGVRHRYFHTDLATERVEQVIDRFIHCGEGRVDHLAAYMDGLETWRKLREEEGCSGIIRGDEGFGARIPVSSELHVRRNVGLSLCTDYRNLSRMARKFRLPGQALPAEFQRRKGETLEGWRDRLYHAHRLPAIVAALSDIKCSYVEVINPLLARSILQRVRQLPERLRTDKALFKEIVDSVGPRVRYAQEGANASPEALLRNRRIVELMRTELRSEEAKRIFGPGFVDELLRGLRHEDRSANSSKRKGWRRFKFLVPRFMKRWIQDFLAKPSLDANVLAFRAFLVLRMHGMLRRDSAAVASMAPAGVSRETAPSAVH